MPVAVVALAAGSFAAGATAFAAATTIAGMVAAGAVMAGAALTVVGTVTGNEKLAKIGAIVGIAGGIGSLVTSAAGAGAGAAEAAASDTASSATEAVGATASDAAGSAADAIDSTVSQSFPVEAPTAEAMPSSGGGMLDAAAPATAAAPAADAAGTSGGGMLDAAQATTKAATDPLAQASTSPASAFDASKTAAGQSAGNAFDASSTASGQAGDINAYATPYSSPNADLSLGQTVAPADPGALSRLSSWAKANPELAKMALNAGGTMVGNLVPSEKDKALMAAYRQQVAASQQSVSDAQRRARWGSGHV